MGWTLRLTPLAAETLEGLTHVELHQVRQLLQALPFARRGLHQLGSPDLILTYLSDADGAAVLLIERAFRPE